MKRKKRRGFFDIFNFGFDDFEDMETEFERMREEMEKIMERMLKNLPREGELPKGVKVHGYSIRIGPDGKPRIQEFGNVKPAIEKKKDVLTEAEREPLVDILEGKDKITIIAEVPGASEKDIQILGDEKILEIKVDSKLRKYHKKIELPKAVDRKNMKKRYKNGILEIILPIKK